MLAGLEAIHSRNAANDNVNMRPTAGMHNQGYYVRCYTHFA